MSKILIVDDSRTSRKILREYFTEAGHEIVAEAENGQEGVEKYSEFKPDIVTLDITMPVLDGLAALKEIKKIDPNAKVVMVTAVGKQNMVVEAIKSGASEFVTKPFDKDNILKIISKLG